MINLVDINYGTKIDDLEVGETFSYDGEEYPHGYYILCDFESSNGKMLGIELRTGNTQGFEKGTAVEVIDFVMMPKQKYMKEKTQEIIEKKKIKEEDRKQNGKPKRYETKKEKQMLLDFLAKTIELRRFPKTKEIDDDDSMKNYIDYYNTFGSKSNICDMVIFEITKDTIEPEFMGALDKLCDSCEKYDGYNECDRHPTDCLLEKIKMEGDDKSG